jgi:CheY-like chemotaxis protein
MNHAFTLAMTTHPTILIAEDSESDRMLIELGFERAKFPFGIQFVHDGFHATEYLNGRGPYANRAKFPVPIVLLTDLKMPRMDGFELLTWIRNHEKWRNLPVVVVTGSNQSEDWHRAMEHGANSYVVKDLLMRPPPALFEAILRHASPAPINPSKVWASRAKKLGS